MCSTSLSNPEALCSILNILYPLQAGDNTTGKEHVTLLSSSDHSDIVTLRDLKEEEHPEVEEEAAASEEFYLGTSCSSQYAFTAAETGRAAAEHTDTLNYPHVFFSKLISFPLTAD